MRAEMQAHAQVVERLADQAARNNQGQVSSAELEAHGFITEEVAKSAMELEELKVKLSRMKDAVMGQQEEISQEGEALARMADREAHLREEYSLQATALDEASRSLQAVGGKVAGEASEVNEIASGVSLREEALEQQLWAVARQEEELTARESQLEQQELAFQQLSGVAESLKKIHVIEGVPYEGPVF